MIAAPYIVVDASVTLKWVFDDEEAVEQAVALRDDAIEGIRQMVAPSLWLYEVTNGLVTGVRRARLDARVGVRILEQLLAVGVRLVDPEPVTVFRLAVQHGLSAYDAAYASLAQALRAPMWTGDRRLRDAVGDPVRWIGDYSGP